MSSESRSSRIRRRRLSGDSSLANFRRLFGRRQADHCKSSVTRRRKDQSSVGPEIGRFSLLNCVSMKSSIGFRVVESGVPDHRGGVMQRDGKSDRHHTIEKPVQ